MIILLNKQFIDLSKILLKNLQLNIEIIQINKFYESEII